MVDRLTDKIHVDGADEAIAKLKGLDKAANAAIRDAAGEIVKSEVPAIQAAARAESKQARLVASVIRAKRDRFPVIVAGGSKKVVPSRKISRSRTEKTKTGRGKLVKPSAGQIFFGAEFGGQGRSTTQQFKPHRGKHGYFFWPTIRRDEEKIARQWLEAVDQVVGEAAR